MGACFYKIMSFSGTSRIQVLKGETLAQKIGSINMNDWQGNTNLQAAFDHVLEIAVTNHISAEEMPKSLIVISDMKSTTAETETGLSMRRWLGDMLTAVTRSRTSSSGTWQVATMYSMRTRAVSEYSW